MFVLFIRQAVSKHLGVNSAANTTVINQNNKQFRSIETKTITMKTRSIITTRNTSDNYN